MKFTRVVPPRSSLPVTVHHYSRLTLDSDAKTAWLDESRQPLKLGRWMFYLPEEQLKFFHARNGMIDCTHASRPADVDLACSEKPLGRYVVADWHRALTTSIYRRLAEIWLVSARLWRAGLGPQPLGLCFVEHFARDGEDLGPTCGIITQNVATLPRKLDCKLEHIQAARVQPDKILSCVRQQRRGYVIDLCSVVGCQPLNAELEVDQMEQSLHAGTDSERLLSMLCESLHIDH